MRFGLAFAAPPAAPARVMPSVAAILGAFGGRVSTFRKGLVLFAGLLILAAIPAVASAENIKVRLDQATIHRAVPQAVTLVVGNPLIADVSIQAGGVMVVTGKGYGITNLIALDRDGKVLERDIIEVVSPTDVVVVYRGVTRESYACAPYCERRITLGDTPVYFTDTLAETGDRNRTAQTGQANLTGR